MIGTVKATLMGNRYAFQSKQPIVGGKKKQRWK